MANNLPANFVTHTRAEWTELANAKDANVRKEVTGALRSLGALASEYMNWSPEVRVNYIMNAQGEGAPEEEKKSSKSSKGTKETATTPSSGGGGGGGGGGMTAADRALLKELQEKVEANAQLLAKVHDLLVVQIWTDPKVKDNAEEMGVAVELLGNG